MNERRLAILLFGVGMLTQSLLYFLDFRWSSSGVGSRSMFTAAVAAAIIGLALELKHRREDKQIHRGQSDGAL